MNRSAFHRRLDQWMHVLQWSVRGVVLGAALAFGIPAIILGISAARVVIGFSGSAILPADCALVFGNAVTPRGVPGPGIHRRMETAARLVNEGQLRMVIVSGGQPPTYARSEAEAMRDVGMKEGIPASSIRLEDRARSTWENLLLGRPLAEGCASVIGISDRYHLARIQLLASRQGWDLATYPADELPAPALETRSIIREVLAYAYYWMRLDRLVQLAPQSSPAASPSAATRGFIEP